MIIDIFIFLFVVLFLFNILYTSYFTGFIRYIIHPINFISLYFSVFFIIPIAFDTFYVPYSFLHMSHILRDHIDCVLINIFILYLLITIINALKINKTPNNKDTVFQCKTYGNALELFISLYLVLIFIILIFLAISMGGIDTIIYNFAEFTIKSRNGNAFILMIIYTVELLPTLYILLSKNQNKIFLSFITLCSMFIVTSIGARTLILSIIISLILALLLTGRINMKTLCKLGIFFLIFFILGSIVRNSSSENSYLGISERINKLLVYFSNNSDQLFTSLYLVEQIEKNNLEYQYGKTIIDAAYFLVPTSIWSEKPRSYYPSRLVFGDIIANGIESNTKQTINFGMFARPYLDFGLIGVLLLNILLFSYLTRVYRTITYPSKNYSTLSILTYIYIYSHVHQIYILGVWSHVISIILVNVIIINLIYYSFLSFNKSLSIK